MRGGIDKKTTKRYPRPAESICTRLQRTTYVLGAEEQARKATLVQEDHHMLLTVHLVNRITQIRRPSEGRKESTKVTSGDY